jgi:hypothetical protein
MKSINGFLVNPVLLGVLIIEFIDFIVGNAFRVSFEGLHLNGLATVAKSQDRLGEFPLGIRRRNAAERRLLGEADSSHKKN